MDKIEGDILRQLKKKNTISGYADIIVASRLVDSNELYEHALQGLITLKARPDQAQARRIGIDAMHFIFTAAIKELEARLLVAIDGSCGNCDNHSYWNCDYCGYRL